MLLSLRVENVFMGARFYAWHSVQGMFVLYVYAPYIIHIVCVLCGHLVVYMSKLNGRKKVSFQIFLFKCIYILFYLLFTDLNQYFVETFW